MRWYPLLFATSLLLSCSDDVVNNESEKELSEQPVVKQAQKGLFFELIHLLKSSGYEFDTVKFRNTYRGRLGYSNNARSYTESGFVLYEVPYSATAPFLYKEMRPGFDFSFDPIEKIRAYYFISQTETKTRPDGIVEEWRIANTQLAKELAEKLALEESKVYVNRGAYVCQKGDRIYIFHSRSVAFYDQLKPVFSDFVRMVNANVPHENKQREIF